VKDAWAAKRPQCLVTVDGKPLGAICFASGDGEATTIVMLLTSAEQMSFATIVKISVVQDSQHFSAVFNVTGMGYAMRFMALPNGF
jgi:hypothetical protein